MSLITTSPSPSSHSHASSTSTSSNTNPEPRPQPRPQSALRPRSTSNGDISRPPPRYSSLPGALPSSAVLLNQNLNQNQNTFMISAMGLDMGIVETSDIAFTEMRPPRYSSVFQTSRSQRDPRRRVPANAGSSSRTMQNAPSGSSTISSSAPQTHEYHIRSGNKPLPWATLKVHSRSSVRLSNSASASGSLSLSSTSSAAQAAQKVPKFTSGDLIQGSLDLNLESPQNINSISLSLRGRIITSSYEGGCYTFLEQPITTWTRANGDPRSVSPLPSHLERSNSGSSPFSTATSSSSSSSSSPTNTASSHPTPTTRTKKFDGKLSGAYAWPFSFPFPTEVVLPGSQSPQPAPQTFLERGTNGSVQYELVLRMTHGMLKSDSKLLVNIVYVPDITPPPSSILRQLAYGEGLRLPGPEVDPLGWHTLPAATVRGKLFNEKNVKLQCTLSLANPQTYTRGTIIPCHISLRSNDMQALDILASPKALSVRLTRHIKYYENGAEQNGNAVEDTAVVEKAVWWVPPNEGVSAEARLDRAMGARRLEGEIHLEKEMQPSCSFALFKISYEVELLPPKSTAFKCNASSFTHATSLGGGPSSGALLSHPVTIATLHGEGPVPVAVTRPQPRKDRGSRTDEDRSYSPPGTQMMIA